MSPPTRDRSFSDPANPVPRPDSDAPPARPLFPVTLTSVGLLVIGLLALLGGAELVVRGSSRLAAAFGMSPLLIGLTLVAFGTSAPEIAVSVEAALAGRGSVALGNVAGSNIFNVLVVLGLSAVVAPLIVKQQLVRMDVPVLIAVSTLPLLLGFNGHLGRAEGWLLLALGVAYTGALAFLAFRSGRGDDGALATGDPASGVDTAGDASRPGPLPLEPPAGRSLKARILDILLVLVGFGALVIGADWLVDGATAIALSLGMSELVVGLTLVAAATSLPELATSVTAAVRGQRDMAVGNVVGSNIFNVLIVLAAASIAAPGGLAVPIGALSFDFPVMLLVAVACLPVFFTGRRISRGEGVIFVLYYGIYLTYILLDAATHDAQDEFVTVVLVFVVPLTVLLALGGWAWGVQRKRERADAEAS